ncbi:biosynthetic peptidoglycan transglycosylase [Ramlibacter algicola]|nr:biosynthetic peptidoglycan transglycosylase [Ramlibacter algicola]
MWFAILLTLLVAAVLGAFLAIRAALAPLPGEWSVPVAAGPVRMTVGVPSAIRLATSWWGGPLLAGHSLPTRHGRLAFAWRDGVLHVRCRPCVLQPPGLGTEALQLDEVAFTVRRDMDRLAGEIHAGRVQGQWRGSLQADRMQVRLDVPWTSLADGYALVAAQVPEVRRAHIEGRFSLTAEFSLPAGTLAISPRIEGFQVAGLGTESWANAVNACGRRDSRLTADHWIARAVIAAEDQRFWEHPGYDLREMAAALVRNEEAQRVERGASTLSQQVAKLLVAGGERSPVRKLRELLYAVEMERTLGKARILRLYLDTAPWGEGLCGADAAAMHYLGVRARDLKPGQASWLAAMLHNPQQEARRWAETGQINLARTQWVALALKGMSRERKLVLAQAIAGVDWAPRWAEPKAEVK